MAKKTPPPPPPPPDNDRPSTRIRAYRSVSGAGRSISDKPMVGRVIVHDTKSVAITSLKQKTRIIYRSSKTGNFVSADYAKRHPATTEKLRVKVKSAKTRKGRRS